MKSAGGFQSVGSLKSAGGGGIFRSGEGFHPGGGGGIFIILPLGKEGRLAGGTTPGGSCKLGGKIMPGGNLNPGGGNGKVPPLGGCSPG